MPELQIRKDHAEGVVEVDTGKGWRGLSPDAAREMAELYDGGPPGAQRFADTLREYADDLE